MCCSCRSRLKKLPVLPGLISSSSTPSLCLCQVIAHVDGSGVTLSDAVSAVSRAGADTVSFLEGLLERLSSGGERRRVKIAKVRAHPVSVHRDPTPPFLPSFLPSFLPPCLPPVLHVHLCWAMVCYAR